MVLQSSGQISFENFIDEFGDPGGEGFGGYRVSQTVGELDNLGLDNNTSNPPQSRLPQSGQISFSDMYGKKLNVVVDHHTSDSNRQNSRSKWNNQNIEVIGGFKSRSQAISGGSGGKRVIIHVNRIIGSSKGNRDNCAVRTGDGWEGNTEMSIDVGAEAEILGAGGNGGRGSESSGNGEQGQDGTSGLGIEYGTDENKCMINIKSGGIISAGFGGGGGGGGGFDSDKEAERHAGGGGGGGGQGWPAGSGGEPSRRGSDGTPGESGSKDEAGEGGEGGNNHNEAQGGEGGNGGESSENSESGEGGRGGEEESEGGSGGTNGSAIRRESSSIKIEIDNNGTIRGSTSETGVS